MQFDRYINIDLEAKKNQMVSEYDLLYPNDFIHEIWYTIYPTLQARPLISDRKIIIKIGNQELTVSSNTLRNNQCSPPKVHLSTTNSKSTTKIGNRKVKVFHPGFLNQDNVMLEFIDQLSGYHIGKCTVPPNIKDFAKLKTVYTIDVIRTLISLYPWLKDINFSNLMIAGGSIVTIIQHLSAGKSVTVNDINNIDFFLFGLNPESCVNKIEELITKIKTVYPDSSFIRTKYALTLVDNNGINKFQIILSTFDTICRILHSFDLGSCKIGIYWENDQFKLVTTQLGLFCLQHRINIIDPRYHSDTYPSRLLKYFDRGYSIVFPKLKLTKKSFNADKQVMLPYITLQIDTIDSNRMIGTLLLKDKISKDPSLFNDGSKMMSHVFESSSSDTVRESSGSSSYNEGISFKKANLDNYFNSQQCIRRFINGNTIFAAKVNPDDFVTGRDAITKSLMIPSPSVSDFLKYIPSIYTDDKLDLKIFEKIPEFDYNEFMACREKGSAYVESYLFSTYYGPKSLEYLAEYRNKYSEFCKLEIHQYREGNLFHMKQSPITDVQWYGEHMS